MPKSKSHRLPSTENKPANKQRKLAQPNYRSLRLSKRIKQPKPQLTGAFRLFGRSLMVLWRHKKLFGGIILVYLVLSVIFVKGFSISSGITEFKPTLLSLVQSGNAQLSTSLTLFGILLGSSGSGPSATSGIYQSILLIIMSLALIWTLRQSLSDKKPKLKLRDSFYKSMYPLIPFLLVLIVIGLQLLPLLLTSYLSGVVFGGGLAVTPIEQGLWMVFLACLALLSLYMVSSSIFALYIATLPDVTPMQALRSARTLVLYRRWVVMRKILFLPVALLVLSGLLVVPIIIVAPTIAEWEFFGLSLLGLAVVHSYVYSLYRELL